MSDRKMMDGLHHVWGEKNSAFFERIDQCGGWPVGFGYVGFAHSDKREAGFCNSRANSGWWTVIASADDYYWWKISAARKEKIIQDVRIASRIEGPNAKTLWGES